MIIATRMQWRGRDERGSILLSGLMLVLTMTLIGSGVFYAVEIENRRALGDATQAQTFYTAEAGLNWALRELADGDGTKDFGQVFNAPGSTTLITNQQFKGGSFTVTAQPVVGSNPKSITVTSTGCVPASGNNPCPSNNTRVTLQGVVTLKFVLGGPVVAGTVSIGSKSVIDSFDSSQGTYAATVCRTTTPPFNCGADVYANGTFFVDTNASVYGNIIDAQGPVTLYDTSVNIYGNITYASPPCQNCTSPQPVYGQVTKTTTYPVVTPSVPTCSWSSYASVSSQITGSGWTYDARTGAFSLSGSGNNITIAGGTLCFGTFFVSGGATVTVSDQSTPTILTLTQGGSFSSNNAIANTTGNTQQLQILSSMSCNPSNSCTPRCSAPGSCNSIVVAGGSSTYIYVYAPQTQIIAQGGSDLYGALLGNDLQLTGGTNVHFDKALGKSDVLAAGVPMYTWGSWHACQNPTCT